MSFRNDARFPFMYSRSLPRVLFESPFLRIPYASLLWFCVHLDFKWSYNGYSALSGCYGSGSEVDCAWRVWIVACGVLEKRVNLVCSWICLCRRWGRRRNWNCGSVAILAMQPAQRQYWPIFCVMYPEMCVNATPERSTTHPRSRGSGHWPFRKHLSWSLSKKITNSWSSLSAVSFATHCVGFTSTVLGASYKIEKQKWFPRSQGRQ